MNDSIQAYVERISSSDIVFSEHVEGATQFEFKGNTDERVPDGEPVGVEVSGDICLFGNISVSDRTNEQWENIESEMIITVEIPEDIPEDYWND